MAPRITSVLILIVALSSCAYGYAGKEAKRRSEREYKPTVKVTINENDKKEEQQDEPEPAKQPESPCGTPTFAIHFYSGSTEVTKTVDCTRRSVVDVKRSEIASGAYADHQAAGLPEESWYLLVDPKSTRDGYLNNAQLLKLSREFAIEYYGRDTSRDLLVYLYQQDDVQ